jgi:hypothetical protein
MRAQAENVSRVPFMLLMNRLKGRLSLKDPLTTSTKRKFQIYIQEIKLS